MRLPFPSSQVWPTPVLTVFIALCLLVVSGCGSSGATSDRDYDDDPNEITKEEIYETNAISITELIVKKVPGITISQTGDGRVVTRIRGRSSFTGDDMPLYVVDGLPTEPSHDGSLPGILITEIESIRVLKGPAETARWGMRGAHGVIEVKTKTGRGD